MDWFAGVLELIGLWLIGNKNRIGFIFSFIGCFIWIYVSIIEEVYGLLLVVIPALIVNIRNYKKWGKIK